jgi:hypothetical protein
MAFAPLILTGNLTIDAADVSDQVMSFKVTGTRGRVEIPATLGQRKSFRPGDDEYEVELEFLQDIDATAVSQILWAQLADTDGTIELAGTLRPGAASATNPEFTMTAVVTGAAFGGTVNTVGTDTQRFPLTDRPTQVTV